MLWVLLSILAGFLVALSDTFNKKFFQKKGYPYMLCARTLGTVPFLLPFFLYLLWNHPQELSYFTPNFILNVLILLSLELTATVLYMKGIKLSPLSLSIPFLSFTPVFIVLTGYIILGEKVSAPGFVGILFVIAGSYLINLPATKQGLLGPFKAIFKEKGSFYLLQVALIYAITSVLGKKGMLLTDPVWFASFYFSLLGIAAGVLLKIWKKLSFLEFFKKDWKKVLVVGSIQALMCYAHMLALKLVETAYMIALKRTSILFAVLLGCLILKEGSFKLRFSAALCMLLGIVIITFLGK